MENNQIIPQIKKEEDEADQGPALTPGQALRKEELVADLAELKAIKAEQLAQKRRLQETIRGFQEELEAVDAAYKQTKKEITTVVHKIRNLQ